MAQHLISDKCQLGLHSPMKLHIRLLQHVCSEHINFQLNLTKNMEMPDALEKGV